MHSLAMAQDILEAALSEADKRGAKHVKAIDVIIRDARFDESDSLQFCLEASTKGTIAERAQVSVEVTETTAKCENCGLIFSIKDQLATCPRCGDKHPELLYGWEYLQVKLKLE